MPFRKHRPWTAPPGNSYGSGSTGWTTWIPTGKRLRTQPRYRLRILEHPLPDRAPARMVLPDVGGRGSAAEPLIAGRFPALQRCHVESRTQVADGKRPGFSELHIKPARTGGRRLGARVVPPIPETVFGRDAGHKRGDDHMTRASDAMDRGHGRHEQRIEREAGERCGRFRPRVQAREGRRAEGARRRPRDVSCAVERRRSLAGANRARQLSLQPVAIGAGDGGNDMA